MSDIPNLKRQVANLWFIVDLAAVLPDISKFGAAVKEAKSAYARYRSAMDNWTSLVDQTESALAVALRLAETSEHLAMGMIRPIYEEMMKAECEFDAADAELEVALTRAETLAEHIDKQFVATGNAEAVFNRAIESLGDLAKNDHEYFGAVMRPPQLLGRRGRPRGSIRPDCCHVVVPLLIAAVQDAGGHLTFNKNYPDDNPLRRALRLLRPFLPPTMDPETWPPARIREAYDRARKGRKNSQSAPSKSVILPPLNGRGNPVHART